jgi:hypothetical protein
MTRVALHVPAHLQEKTNRLSRILHSHKVSACCRSAAGLLECLEKRSENERTYRAPSKQGSL